jgi:hypothetical protein
MADWCHKAVFAQHPARMVLEPSQSHRLDKVIRAFGEDQRRAGTRRQDVLLEIGQICALPDRCCGGDRFIVRQQRITVEVRPWIVERGVAEGQKALHVPIAQHRHVRVDPRFPGRHSRCGAASLSAAGGAFSDSHSLAVQGQNSDARQNECRGRDAPEAECFSTKMPISEPKITLVSRRATTGPRGRLLTVARKAR